MSRLKRRVIVLSVMLIVTAALTISAFAAGSSDNGFFLWDLLDGIAGFFRDLINSVGRFITSVISAIKNAVNALLSGLKKLFIPSKESFSKFRDDILQTFDKKFGSVFSAIHYLNGRFKNLGAKRDMKEAFKVTFPRNSFLSGISIDFLSPVSDILSWIRLCMTGIFCLITALMCYNKVISMVKD